jgi:hypothetical protein
VGSVRDGEHAAGAILVADIAHAGYVTEGDVEQVERIVAVEPSADPENPIESSRPERLCSSQLNWNAWQR